MTDEEINRLIDSTHFNTFDKVWKVVRNRFPAVTSKKLRQIIQKRRYNISRESYKIETRSGNVYTIIAEDGTTKDVPRWKLIPVKANEKHVNGKTLNTDKGIVTKINSEVSANKVNVKFHMPDGSEYSKDINRRELRFPTPQFKSKLEIEFEKRNRH